MVERAYPVTYMIALGMVLLLSHVFVRKTIGFADPIDRSYLPFFFLGSGFMLVETKAITELGLHLGRNLVRDRGNISTAFAYNLMGALFGGVMEYNSMYFGFAFLYLLALGFYSLAWMFSWKSTLLICNGAASAGQVLAKQRIHIDIDLARRLEVTNLKAVGLKAVFHEADLLGADHFLPRIGNDEAGGRRPDVADVAIGKIPALMDMAAGDQPQVDGAQHLNQAAAHRHRNITDRRCIKLGIVGRVQVKRFVKKQRYRLAIGA
jgi:hypothetical protein